MTMSSSSTPRSRPSGNVVETLRRWPLISFFVLAYVVTWLLQTPLLIFGIPVFSATTHAPSFYLLPSIAIGVTGSAFLMTAVTQGRAGVRRLLQRIAWWRVGLQWFAVAVLLIPISELLVAVALGSPDALRAFTPAALLFYPAAYISHFFFGPLFEEPGWRGFALPRLQHRYGPLRGTLLLGVLWSAWHFFLYVPTWLQDSLANLLAGLVVFTLMTTSMTFIFTWLFNNTQASVLLAILLHGSVDGTATYLQVLADKGMISSAAAAASTQFGLLIACVLWAVLLTAATRARLSYQRYRGEAEQLDLNPSTQREPRPPADW
jgi:membrane protease YdiL (CAAX protease family)